jgi:hypothetical protein
VLIFGEKMVVEASEVSSSAKVDKIQTIRRIEAATMQYQLYLSRQAWWAPKTSRIEVSKRILVSM